MYKLLVMTLAAYHIAYLKAIIDSCLDIAESVMFVLSLVRG